MGAGSRLAAARVLRALHLLAHPRTPHTSRVCGISSSSVLSPAIARFEATLSDALERRRANGMLRSLTVGEDADGRPLVDFGSNDYLGLAKSRELREEVARRLARADVVGSTGSRLLTGNTRAAEALERRVAGYHGGESALVFNSGYDANTGFFGAVPQAGDVVFADELSHASVNEGMRLSRATKVPFRHNDVGDLEAKMQALSTSNHRGAVFVAVESVYSMDGDIAPLLSLARLCEKRGALLVVDEAHATGVYGPGGRGLVSALRLEGAVYARLHTFGKGLGCHGAAMVCPRITREYLVNYARPFIYSTALSHDAIVAVDAAYDLLEKSADAAQEKLRSLVLLFKHAAQSNGLPRRAIIPSDSPIQGALFPGNAAAVAAATELRQDGFLVHAIRAPTVPAGTERIRVVLHAHNTEDEVERFVRRLAAVWARTAGGAVVQESVS